MTSKTPLERLEWLVWILFLVWSAVGAVVMPWNPGTMEVSQYVPEAWQDFAYGFLRIADAVWILLAATTIYFWMIRNFGLALARLQAAIIITGSAVIEWIGQDTGWPFGPYLYTENFGPRLFGKLPIAIPLAWLVIVVCSTAVVRTIPCVRNRYVVAGCAALVALATDINLEPVAWRVKGYWLWYPFQDAAPTHPPLQNYASWFVLSFLFVACMPGLRHEPATRAWIRPALVLGIINVLLAVTHLVHIAGGR
jgi:uncharacterized membrane protein